MLAEVLERSRDQVVAELERRAAATESTELLITGRRRRLDAFVQEVIGALRRGAIDDPTQVSEPLAPFTDPALELRERELLRRYLVEQIEHNEIQASPGETVIVAEWVGDAERRRLRAQNQRLSALLDAVQDSAALFGPDGRILYCNRRAFQGLRDTMGLPRREVIGRTPAELGIPGEIMIGRPIDELMRLARARESFEMDARGRSNEGQLDAVYQPDGSVGAVALVIRDVQHRKLAQTRLDLLTKLSALVGLLEYEDVAEGLTYVPIPEFADWCVINCIERKRIRRTFIAHRDPSKAPLRDALLRELPVWGGRHPLWQEMMTGGFQLLTEVSDDFLHRVAGTDAQYRLLSQLQIRSALVMPLVSRGQITGIITFLYTDESGRRYGRDDPPVAEEIALHAAQAFETARLMKDLRASETRFRIALAGARTVVYEQDTALRYVWYYNPLLSQNLLGKTHAEELPADEARILTNAKRRVLEEGESMQEEMDFTFDNMERRHFRETIEPLRDETGKIVGVIGAATDITEQQRTQQQLTAELDFRERMMGILGHDLRNPLGTTVMASDLLLRRADLGEEVRDPLLRIRRAAGRMQEMIDTLLDFTRARFLGKVPVTRVPGDLEEIAHGAVDELRLVWPDHAIGMQVRGDSGGEWDPARMAQTITNLVGNAIAYGERGTPVEIAIEGHGRDVELKVHNHGPPIPSELVPMLFEPFRRGVPEDRSPRGLGLGLYIVQEIVHGHDGTIGVDSTAHDGTTFTLHLPRHHPATTTAHAG